MALSRHEAPSLGAYNTFLIIRADDFAGACMQCSVRFDCVVLLNIGHMEGSSCGQEGCLVSQLVALLSSLHGFCQLPGTLS